MEDEKARAKARDDFDSEEDEGDESEKLLNDRAFKVMRDIWEKQFKLEMPKRPKVVRHGGKYVRRRNRNPTRR